MTIGGTSDTTGTVSVAINGALQGSTTTIAGGNWTISGVTVNSGDIVTVFISDATADKICTGVTKYDGTGNITSLKLNAHVLYIGSDDNASLTLTNLRIS